MVSRFFVEAVKLAPKRMYVIAHEARLHPSTLSKIVNGIDIVRPNDPRVVRVALVLGLDVRSCFESVATQEETIK